MDPSTIHHHHLIPGDSVVRLFQLCQRFTEQLRKVRKYIYFIMKIIVPKHNVYTRRRKDNVIPTEGEWFIVFFAEEVAFFDAYIIIYLPECVSFFSFFLLFLPLFKSFIFCNYDKLPCTKRMRQVVEEGTRHGTALAVSKLDI